MLVKQPWLGLNDVNGAPYAGAKAYFYLTTTTTPAAVYQDSALVSPHAVPVVANSEGRFPAIFAPATPLLRVKIISATGSLASPLEDIDPINESTFSGGGGSTGAAVNPNLLLNASFVISQVNGLTNTVTADDAYALDATYVLTQTASVQVQQVIEPEDGYAYMQRITQNQAGAQRIGFAQILRGKTCKHLRGGSGTFTPRIRISTGQKINYAILGWNGTEDAVTSDVVNNWANTSLTPGQFFINTVDVLAVGNYTPNASTWFTFPALTTSMGSSFTNVILFVWTDATVVQTGTLDCDFWKFEAGTAMTAFVPKDPALDLWDCYEYTWVWAAGGNFDTLCAAVNTTGQGSKGYVPLPRPMFGNPAWSLLSGNLAYYQDVNIGAATQNAVVVTLGSNGYGGAIINKGVIVSLDTSAIVTGTGWIGSANLTTTKIAAISRL